MAHWKYLSNRYWKITIILKWWIPFSGKCQEGGYLHEHQWGASRPALVIWYSKHAKVMNVSMWAIFYVLLRVKIHPIKLR